MATPPEAAVVADGKKSARKPGRPPKKKTVDIIINSHGIVTDPLDTDNVLELSYDNPMLFKQLLSLYKKHDLSEITFDFREDRVELRLQNERGKCTLLTTLYGRMLVRYYCAEPISCTVKRENLDKIFKSKDKNYPQVTFILRRDDARSKMYVLLANGEVDAKLQYEVDLIIDPPNKIVNQQTDENYSLKFKLPSGHFKKLINDIHSSETKDFKLKKEGKEPINICYDHVGKLNLAATYHNESKIDLQSTLEPEDIFSITVPINHIKPFADAKIGDEVHISADKFQDFSLWAEVDRKKCTRPDGTVVEGPVCKIQLFAAIERMQTPNGYHNQQVTAHVLQHSQNT